MHSLDDEKLTYVIHNSGQNRETWFLIEEGKEANNVCTLEKIRIMILKDVWVVIIRIWLSGLSITKKGWYDVSAMLRVIDEDEKVKKIAPIYNVYNGQYENQECLFLTEDGLYEVLMQSNPCLRFTLSRTLLRFCFRKIIIRFSELIP